MWYIRKFFKTEVTFVAKMIRELPNENLHDKSKPEEKTRYLDVQ